MISEVFSRRPRVRCRRNSGLRGVASHPVRTIISFLKFFQTPAALREKRAEEFKLQTQKWHRRLAEDEQMVLYMEEIRKRWACPPDAEIPSRKHGEKLAAALLFAPCVGQQAVREFESFLKPYIARRDRPYVLLKRDHDVWPDCPLPSLLGDLRTAVEER